MTAPIFEVTKAALFDAAHSLPEGLPGEYRRIHGHSFQVEATVGGPLQEPIGWVVDLGALDRALKALALELDHGLLNDKPGLESPTLERLCAYFADKLRTEFPGLTQVVVSRPTLSERCTLKLFP